MNKDSSQYNRSGESPRRLRKSKVRHIPVQDFTPKVEPAIDLDAYLVDTRFRVSSDELNRLATPSSRQPKPVQVIRYSQLPRSEPHQNSGKPWSTVKELSQTYADGLRLSFSGLQAGLDLVAVRVYDRLKFFSNSAGGLLDNVRRNTNEPGKAQNVYRNKQQLVRYSARANGAANCMHPPNIFVRAAAPGMALVLLLVVALSGPFGVETANQGRPETEDSTDARPDTVQSGSDSVSGDSSDTTAGQSTRPQQTDNQATTDISQSETSTPSSDSDGSNSGTSPERQQTTTASGDNSQLTGGRGSSNTQTNQNNQSVTAAPRPAQETPATSKPTPANIPTTEAPAPQVTAPETEPAPAQPAPAPAEEPLPEVLRPLEPVTEQLAPSQEIRSSPEQPEQFREPVTNPSIR